MTQARDSAAHVTASSERGRDWDNVRGYTGPGSMTWRMGREWALLLGAGRAVLMQLAHPLVAAGVAQHSSFSGDPLGRSFRTVEFTQVMAFGTREQVHAMARRVNHLHAGVVGELGRDAGPYGAQSAYRARDPELLLWVYATLVDTGLALYPLLVGPLTRAEQRRYYEESTRTAILLGLPQVMLPPTLDDFEVYVREMLASDRLSVTPQARALGHQMLYLPVPAPIRPLQPIGEQVTAGLLPPRLREGYGFSWSERRERMLRVSLTAIRRALPLVPSRLRYTPWSRSAAKRVAVTPIPH